MRLMNRWVFGAVAGVALAFLLAPAFAGAGSTVTFSLLGAEGMPGGAVGVTLALSGDDGSAVSAGVDIVYPDGDLSFAEPVSMSCVIDARIAATHVIAGRILSPGTVNVEIAVLGAPDPLPALGDGDLAVCDFAISGDAMDGDMFPVEPTNVFVGDAMGGEIDSSAQNGVVSVGDGVDPTVTPMPSTPTSTPTSTGTPPVGCAIDSDCPTGTTCQDGACLPKMCMTDDDCPPGSSCALVPDGAATSGASDGTCVPRPCADDAECNDPSAVCDDDGLCRPQFCTESADCDDGEQCTDGVCEVIPPACEDDSQCMGGVCVDEVCVDCREEGDCDPGEVCSDSNECIAAGVFDVVVGSASGLAGTTVSVLVALGHTSGDAADMVRNYLAAGAGLTITDCAASDGISGTFEGLPGTTVTAELGGDSAGVPAGGIYSCSVAIAEGAPAGTAAIECPMAEVNGEEVLCTGGEVNVMAGPPATPTPAPTEVPTATRIPTDTPTSTPSSSRDDDSCAVGPVSSNSSPIGNMLMLLVPAMLLWRRRRT